MQQMKCVCEWDLTASGCVFVKKSNEPLVSLKLGIYHV